MGARIGGEAAGGCLLTAGVQGCETPARGAALSGVRNDDLPRGRMPRQRTQ